MVDEVWKDIGGYEGFYQVSNLGRVRSLDRFVFVSGKKTLRRGKILKSRSWKANGKRFLPYEKISLSRDGVSRNFYLHKIVAISFIPNKDGKPQVDHIDGDIKNNCVENLRWCTQKENNNNVVFRKKQSLLYNGEIARDVAFSNGISYDIYRGRIARGWDLKRAITEKPRGR